MRLKDLLKATRLLGISVTAKMRNLSLVLSSASAVYKPPAGSAKSQWRKIIGLSGITGQIWERAGNCPQVSVLSRRCLYADNCMLKGRATLHSVMLSQSGTAADFLVPSILSSQFISKAHVNMIPLSNTLFPTHPHTHRGRLSFHQTSQALSFASFFPLLSTLPQHLLLVEASHPLNFPLSLHHVAVLHLS